MITFFFFYIILLHLPQYDLNTYQPVNGPIELYLEWLSNQGPQSKYEYSAFCQGHSKLPIHTAPCLPQFPQQPITNALESRETIATLRPWMLLAGSIEWKRKETEVKFKEKTNWIYVSAKTAAELWRFNSESVDGPIGSNRHCFNSLLTWCSSQSLYLLFQISLKCLFVSLPLTPSICLGWLVVSNPSCSLWEREVGARCMNNSVWCVCDVWRFAVLAVFVFTVVWFPLHREIKSDKPG